MPMNNPSVVSGAGNRGVFANTTLLQAAYPAAANTGSTAWVGSGTLVEYYSNGTAWVIVSSASAGGSTAMPGLWNFWRALKAGSATCWILGDSTSYEENYPLLYTTLRQYSIAGQALAGTTFFNAGANGNTLSNFLNTPADATWPTRNYNALVAAQPPCVSFRYGINDVRQGQITLSQFTALVQQFITQMATACPNTDIQLAIPNCLTMQDSGAQHFVRETFNGVYVDQATNGNGAVAQAYSDILAAAYRSFEGKYKNVTVCDTRKAVFGDISPAANTGVMVDQLHPSNDGFRGIARAVVAGLTPPVSAEADKTDVRALPYSQAKEAAAITINAASPWAVYPRILENPQFASLISRGRLSVVDATTLTVDGTGADANAFGAIDIVYFPRSETAFLLSPGFRQIPITSQWRIGCTAVTNYASAVAGEPVYVYRPLFNFDEGINRYLRDPAYLSKRLVRVESGGTNYFIISSATNVGQLPNMAQYAIKAGDFLCLFGQSPITITAAANTASGAHAQINQAGSFGGYAGLYGYLFSTRPNDGEYRGMATVSASYLGTLPAATTIARAQAARPLYVGSIYATLETAGSGGNTIIEIYVNTVLRATITFPTGNTLTPTITWASGSNFTLVAGDRIQWKTTTVSGSPAEFSCALDTF